MARRMPQAPALPPGAVASSALASRRMGHPVRAVVETGVVNGTIDGDARLSDTLNGRERIVIRGATRTTNEGATEWVADRLELDPYDVELVIGEALTTTPAQRGTGAVFKRRHPVRLSTGRIEVRGTLHLLPGVPPERALHQPGPRFVPITDAVIEQPGRMPLLDCPVVLVNRAYVRVLESRSTPA